MQTVTDAAAAEKAGGAVLADAVLAVAGDALRRANRLAASGVELGLIGTDSRTRQPGRALDAPRSPGRSCGMRHRAALLVVTIAALALVFAHTGPAYASGGCAIASAQPIASGATQSANPASCPDGLQYWSMSLASGDTLNVDALPSGGLTMALDIYGPDVGTIGHALCSRDSDSFAYRLSCQIPATGTYVLVISGASGSFTPSVRSVPAQSGRVNGSCDPATALSAPSAVTQYANSELCQPSGAQQYWQLSLVAGDELKISALPFGGLIMSVDVYGPNPTTLGTALCGTDSDSFAYVVSCPIEHTGRYLMVVGGAGAVTPVAVHPTTLSVTTAVKGGGALTVGGHVKSDAPRPTGTCLVEVKGARGWTIAARVQTANGTFKARLHTTRRGKLLLRVLFHGAKGWASSTSKTVIVVVP